MRKIDDPENVFQQADRVTGDFVSEYFGCILITILFLVAVAGIGFVLTGSVFGVILWLLQ